MSEKKLVNNGQVGSAAVKPPLNAGQTGTGGNGGRIPPKGGSGTAPPTNQRK